MSGEPAEALIDVRPELLNMLQFGKLRYHVGLTSEIDNMNANQAQPVRPFTINDIHVGCRLYEALVQHAAANPGRAIRYGDLLAVCREANSADAIVQRAVPIGIGMKLLFVQAFCDKHGYPNLACLAVNASGRPGDSYPGNWELDMLAVAAFDWSQAPANLAIYVAEATVKATPAVKCRAKEPEVRNAIFEDYKTDRSRYRSFDHDDREEMVNLMMECVPLAHAYQAVMDAKAEQGKSGEA